jgi:hypothetical protein
MFNYLWLFLIISKMLRAKVRILEQSFDESPLLFVSNTASIDEKTSSYQNVSSMLREFQLRQKGLLYLMLLLIQLGVSRHYPT